MKKLFIASAMMLTSLLSTAGTIGVDVDYVYNKAGDVGGTAHILRWNDTIDGINYGLSNRTVRYGSNPNSDVPSAKLKSADGWGMWNNFEGSVGKTFKITDSFALSPFVGLGYDDGQNGAVGTAYGYGRIGVSTGFQIGPGRWNTTLTRRVNYEPGHLEHSMWLNNYSIPLNDRISVNLRISRGWQDKLGIVPKTYEDYKGIGFTYKF
jgi:hypothetical protein